MTLRRPLVRVGGRVRQLPDGDELPGAAGPQPVIDHGDVATSGSETVACDVTASDFHMLSMATANTSGTLTVQFTNIPDTTNARYSWHVRLRRGGRKAVAFDPAVTWAGGVAPTLGSLSTAYDVLMFYKVGSEPIRGMLIDAW